MRSKISAFIALSTALFFMTGCNDNSTTAEKDKNDTAVSQESNVSMDTANHMDKMQMNMANGLMDSMNSMMSKMKNMSLTGDFDIDFANMMIQHHQSAIDMSRLEVSTGKNEKIKSVAQKIIDSQKEEISKLQNFVNSYKPSGMKHGEGELKKSMSEMESAMKTMQMSGDIDKDFAAMMIMHHEHGIAMGKMELANGMSNKLKQMAKKEISSQTEDIKEMRDLLQSK